MNHTLKEILILPISLLVGGVYAVALLGVTLWERWLMPKQWRKR